MNNKTKWHRRFPLKYKHLYELLHWLKKKSTVVSFFVGIISICLGIIIHYYFKDVKVSFFFTAGLAVAYFLLYKIYKIIVVVFIRNTGSKNQFILPKKYVEMNAKKKYCVIHKPEDLSNFEFATIETAYIASRLNLECYSNGAWETSIDNKYRRNVAHIIKNEYAFLFNKHRGSYSSYTHMFPVPEWLWKKYLNSEIGDNDFDSEWISPVKWSSNTEKPYGIILFSVGSLRYQRIFQRRKIYYREKLGDILERGISFHLNTILDKCFDKDTLVPILLQNESDIYFDWLKGIYTKNDKPSYDGATIIIFNAYNC